MSCQEELGVPYDIQKYYRNSLQQAPKELLEVNPLGKISCCHGWRCEPGRKWRYHWLVHFW